MRLASHSRLQNGRRPWPKPVQDACGLGRRGACVVSSVGPAGRNGDAFSIAAQSRAEGRAFANAGARRMKLIIAIVKPFKLDEVREKRSSPPAWKA